MVAALEYAKKGWQVFPLKPGEKVPLTVHGFKDASIDARVIRKWWTEHPVANIGIATGSKSGLVVLDFDVKNGKPGREAFAKLQANHGSLITRMARTPSGGWHLYFAYRGTDIGSRADYPYPGVDIRGEGGYVVAPPSHLGANAAYNLISDDDPEPLPETIGLAGAKANGGGKTSFNRASVLDGVPEGSRDDHIFRYACGLRARNLDYSEALTLVLDAASKARPAFESELAVAKLDSAWKYPVGRKPAENETAPPDTQNWTKRFLLSKKDELVSCIQNAVLILDNDTRWVGVLAFDEFSSTVIKRRSPPHDDGAIGGWNDEDDTMTAAWLSENYRVQFNQKTIRDIVLVIAKRHPFHLLRDKIEALEWDGTPRLEDALADLFGTPKNAYTQKVGVCFFVQAVARVFKPGCKADGVLILEGSQGLGKSRAVAALSYGYFMDTPMALGERDGFLALRGKWIVEMSELDSMNRVENTRAKQFFSARRDTYRAPYARDQITAPRQCVFVGTTNQHEFLRDETGARRFWPISCTTIDVSILSSLRDQLWAEAVKRYKAGEIWWVAPDDPCWQAAEAEQEVRYRDDVWEDEIAHYLVGKSETTLSDLFWDALGMKDKARWDHSAQIRLGIIMRRLGWQKRRVRRNGTLAHVYVTKPMHISEGDCLL